MDELAELQIQVQRVRRHLDRRVGEVRHLAQSGKQVQDELKAAQDEVELYGKAVGLLTSTGEERQATTQQQIEALVTRGLQTIFEEDLSFHITQTVRGKLPVVDFVVRTTLADGSTVDTEVMSARGGGLAAVVGFLLRLVILLLSKNKRETVLFLDETFAHLSAEYAPRMAAFLRELVDLTGVQVVMVTHQPDFVEVADVRYEFSLVSGETVIKEI